MADSQLVTEDCGPKNVSVRRGKSTNGSIRIPKPIGRTTARIMRRLGKFASGERSGSLKDLSDPSRLERDFQRRACTTVMG
jgi:hypothetical protein